MRIAVESNIKVIAFGPPGMMWSMPIMSLAIEDLDLQLQRMRLCHFNERFDESSDSPSGTYLQVATNLQIPQKDMALQMQPEHQAAQARLVRAHKQQARTVARQYQGTTHRGALQRVRLRNQRPNAIHSARQQQEKKDAY